MAPDENHSPRSPRSPRTPLSPGSRGHRPRLSLSGAFGDPDFSLSEAVHRMNLNPRSPTSPSSSKQAQQSTWKSRHGYPNWSTIRKHNSDPVALNFTIAIRGDIPDYSSRYALNVNRAAFQDAAAHIHQVRDLVEQLSRKGSESELDEYIAEMMSHVVFGSNMIERVGCGLNETIRICREIFLEERTIYEAIEPRSKEYTRKLEELISRDQGGEPVKIRERREVVNHAAAFVFIAKQVVKNNQPITEDLIKETHRILTNGISAGSVSSSAYGGVYRNVAVGAGSTNFVVPHRVPQVMSRFVQDLNDKLGEAEDSAELDPFYIAAFACSEFVNIHPFLDGNGRICRLLLNVILLKYAGICASIGEHDEDRKEYMEIAMRRSEEECGAGELSTFTMRKGLGALKNMVGKLSMRGRHR